MQKKKEELYSPIIKKAEDAINAIAKEKGYSYIFDTSVGAVLFAQESDDVMALVKAKLSLK
jgi:outer membrane protein